MRKFMFEDLVKFGQYHNYKITKNGKNIHWRLNNTKYDACGVCGTVEEAFKEISADINTKKNKNE